MAMIDPVYVYKGPKQPNILTGYPMYNPSLYLIRRLSSANRMTVLQIRTTPTP